VHFATATSQFVLAIMALSGTLAHVVNGVFRDGVRTLVLRVGVFVRAQIGARVSNRIQAASITRELAVALGLVGLRILMLAR